MTINQLILLDTIKADAYEEMLELIKSDDFRRDLESNIIKLREQALFMDYQINDIRHSWFKRKLIRFLEGFLDNIDESRRQFREVLKADRARRDADRQRRQMLKPLEGSVLISEWETLIQPKLLEILDEARLEMVFDQHGLLLKGWDDWGWYYSRVGLGELREIASRSKRRNK